MHMCTKASGAQQAVLLQAQRVAVVIGDPTTQTRGCLRAPCSPEVIGIEGRQEPQGAHCKADDLL